MKRDIKWLKERVLSKKKSAELNVMAHREGLSEDFESRVIAYESVLKDINQLDKPETLSQEWIDKYAQGDYGAWVYTKDLQDLLVPKRELPVIPNYVAKWISERHEIFDLYQALKSLENNELNWEDVHGWYRKNTRKFVNAYLTGEYEVKEEQKGEYEVKEEQKYVLLINITDKASKTNYETYLNKRGIFHSMENESFNSEEFNWSEEEIKDLENGEILFEHFAVKVEELEE